MLGTPVYAQKLKPVEQAKVDALKARYNKAQSAQNSALSVRKRYHVFLVSGKVQAGDNTSARIYGQAIPTTNFGGPGTLSEDNILVVKSPVKSEYVYGDYRGYCTFMGVIKGVNTYLPVAIQKEYVTANKDLQKWQDIINSIQSEIDAIYLPYRQKENQKKLIKEKAELDALLNTVSIIPGKQLGKIHLGMTKDQVIALMGKPASTTLLHRDSGKIIGPGIMTPEGMMYDGNAPTELVETKVRRDRYFLKSRAGLDIHFEDSRAIELEGYASEYGEERFENGELKTRYSFNVIYVDGKAVQLESDSPEFFTGAGSNIKSTETILPKIPEGSFYGGMGFKGSRGAGTMVSHYYGDMKVGLSVCLQDSTYRVFAFNPSTAVYPPACRLKWIIHLPNTVAITDDYESQFEIPKDDVIDKTKENAN